MNILSFLKIFTTLLNVWHDYVTKKRIKAEIELENQKVQNEQVNIANDICAHANELPESTDKYNRD
jgi:hypothetical protein